MDKNKTSEVSKLSDGIIGAHDGLSSFLSSNTDSHISFLDHRNIVGT